MKAVAAFARKNINKSINAINQR